MRRSHLVHDSYEHFAQIHRREDELQATPETTAGEIKDLLDHAGHATGAGPQTIEVFDEFRILAPPTQNFEAYVDRSQRLTQVVPHDCDEPFPQLSGFLGALPLL